MQKTYYRFALITLIVSASMLSGCNSRRALIEHRFGEVEPEVLVDIGDEGDATHAKDLVALLESRRANAGDQVVGDEQAVEALIALEKIEYEGDAELILDLADEDESSDVRYFAVKMLKAIHPDLLATKTDDLKGSEDDPLILRLLDE